MPLYLNLPEDDDLSPKHVGRYDLTNGFNFVMYVGWYA